MLKKRLEEVVVHPKEGRGLDLYVMLRLRFFYQDSSKRRPEA
jgi:hypothetical protein